VWGLGELRKRTRDEAFDARWMALPLSGMLRADRATGVMLSIKLVVDGDEVAIRVHDGQVSFTHPDDPADVTIEGPADALVAAVTTPGTRAHRLRVHGERRQVDGFL
jgi:hypothetical protein